MLEEAFRASTLSRRGQNEPTTTDTQEIIISQFLIWFQIFKDQCGSFLSISVAVFGFVLPCALGLREILFLEGEGMTLGMRLSDGGYIKVQRFNQRPYGIGKYISAMRH